MASNQTDETMNRAAIDRLRSSRSSGSFTQRSLVLKASLLALSTFHFILITPLYFYTFFTFCFTFNPRFITDEVFLVHIRAH
jgi:hypothetical protein